LLRVSGFVREAVECRCGRDAFRLAGAVFVEDEDVELAAARVESFEA
jgi:hypothetical protein